MELTAIVTMSDSGGSSGRLRKELGILPPGDIRRIKPDVPIKEVFLEPKGKIFPKAKAILATLH